MKTRKTGGERSGDAALTCITATTMSTTNDTATATDVAGSKRMVSGGGSGGSTQLITPVDTLQLSGSGGVGVTDAFISKDATRRGCRRRAH
jgi:hypothetical protein